MLENIISTELCQMPPESGYQSVKHSIIVGKNAQWITLCECRKTSAILPDCFTLQVEEQLQLPRDPL